MATRDRSVGIGFSNTNVYTLYKKAQAASALAKAQTIATAAAQPLQAQAMAQSVAQEIEQAGPRIFRQDELSELKIARFQPKALGSVIKAEPEMKVEMKSEIQEQLSTELKGLEDLKSNLNRLQDMHGKLRFMLKELEDLVAKKK